MIPVFSLAQGVNRGVSPSYSHISTLTHSIGFALKQHGRGRGGAVERRQVHAGREAADTVGGRQASTVRRG